MGTALGRQIASKWLKSKTLKANPYIARHIPQARLFNASNLKSMLIQYGMVVLKPVCGTGGIGVIKVERLRKGFKLSHRSQKTRYASYQGLLSALKLSIRGRSYLIQRGIQLATIQKRPIDYRVKYVKHNGVWVIRAMVGRLARPGLFVTNLCRGGTLMTAAQGIRKSLTARLIGPKKKEMRQLTKQSTALLESRYQGIGQLGYDYGIDRKGHIWMLEVNTRPH